MISSSATRPLIEQLILIGTLLLTSNSALGAQPTPSPTPVNVTIMSASASQLTDRKIQPDQKKPIKGWTIYVLYSEEFNTANGSADALRVHDSSNFRILNASSGAFVPVSSSDFDAPISGASNNRVKLIVPSPDGLNADDVFYLFTPNLVFKGVRAKTVPMRQIEIQKETTSSETVRREQSDIVPKPVWGLIKSKARDDSDIYASYELTKARGIATTGTGDLKVAIPFFANFWSRTSKFSPLVDIKASSDERPTPIR